MCRFSEEMRPETLELKLGQVELAYQKVTYRQLVRRSFSLRHPPSLHLQMSLDSLHQKQITYIGEKG